MVIRKSQLESDVAYRNDAYMFRELNSFNLFQLQFDSLALRSSG